MVYSEGVERALRVAVDAHDGQVRKGADVPYFVHPVHVALMLARWGLDDEHIQAGILHDVVEDCDGWTVGRVAEEFGEAIAGMVDELTEDKGLSWEERKQAAIDHVEHMSSAGALVKAADKLHNLECLRASLREADDPAQVWAHFNGGRERTLAKSAGLVEALAPRVPDEIATALRDVVRDLSAL